MKSDQGGVLDALPAMAWTALPDGSVDLINRRWCDYCGLGSGEERWEWQAVVHPDDLDGLLEDWRSIIASGQPGEMDARIHRADGEYRRFLIQCSPVHDQAGQLSKWCGTATDVEETVRQREFDFQAIVDSIPIPVAVTSSSGDVEALNKPTLDYFGKTFEELRGWKASEVVHPDDLERTISEQIAAHQEGSSYHVESRHRRSDGVYRWYSVYGLPLRDRQGQILRWLHLLIDIDDRKRAEDALRESERKARAIVNGIPGLVATLTADGKTDVVNYQMAAYHGLPPDELKKWSTNKTIHDDDLPEATEIFNKAIASGVPYELEYRLRRFDGMYRWFYSRGIPLHDAAGRIVCWYALQTDIDDRKKAEESLRESERNTQTIMDSIPAGIGVLGPSGEVEAVNKHMVDYFGKSEEELKDWSAIDIVHPDDLQRVLATRLHALTTGKAYSTDQRLRGADGTFRWFRVRGRPLYDGDGNILRWYLVYAEIDEKKRAEDALAASERNLQLIIDTIPALAWSGRPDGSDEFLSKHYVEYVGLSPEQVPGWDYKTALHPDDWERLDTTWKSAVVRAVPMEAEGRLRRHDGKYRWFLFRANPLRDDNGNIAKWYGVSTDIDDMKRAQEALATSERDLQATLDTIPARVGVFSDDGTRVSVNKRTVELSGIPAVADWRLVFHPDDLPLAESRWKECLTTGEDFECEYRARMADGTYRWHLGRRVPLRDDTGKIIRWYGIAHDIEDRKRAEQALQESERQSRLIVDSIPARVGIYDTEGNRISANKRALELSGYAIGSDWREVFHRDDLERAEELWRASLANGEPFECEYRARMADGTYRWHIGRRVPMRDETGKVIRWYGVSTDIEDRKRAEQALAASERELRLILDCIPARVSVHDTNGIRVAANRQSIELSGLPGDADWRELFHPDDVGLAEKLWRESLAKEEPFEAEYRARMADGTYRWHLGRRVPIRDETGKVIRWYGVSSDIEDRKRAEEALAASERNLQLTVDTIPTLAWAARLDGTAEFLNKHYLDYVGLTAEGAQDWGWAAAVHPEDMTGLADTWQTIMASGKPGETEARLRRHDGEYRWFLFRANPLHDEHGKIVRWYGVNTDIEDRKRSEEGFRAIVETTPECVKVVARDGTVLRTNAAGAIMAGVPSIDNVIGQRFFDFVAPEHQEKYHQFHEKICAGEKGFLEFDLINAQGVRRHMETHAAPLRNSDGSIAQLGITRDMTARKRAEDALRRSEAFLAEGQHLARMGNLSWHVTSGEIIWSEQLYRIFEFEPDTVITLDRMASRVHPEDMPMIVNTVERAQRGDREFECQPRIVLPDQSVKYLHLIAHRAGCHGDGQIEYIGAVLDITQRRLSEEALEKLRSELAQVTRIMSLGALTASIAHEVNQPLAGIITNASTCLRMLASDPPNVDGAQETARRTIRDGKRAADVIARLRALFTKRAVTSEPVDLNDAAQEVVALLSADLQRNRVTLRIELADELPMVAGDRVQLQQVIMNLLRNAADAMSDIKDRPRLLQVRTAGDEDGQVRLTVRDAGIGFSPEGAERLFEAFYTTKSDGMGIGLSVSRSIIERHNGRLWAQANDGPGATFAFSIPHCSTDATSVDDVAMTKVAHGNTQIPSEFS
ncbi:PAS domain-containing protein [Mesorhizobium neociceri]|uniref:histidine kinase n=1 Tax=Mesorhizobium neociceri TaxID=1307853 RepID=A0A838BCQ8_9HYPH|nr:PAS domain-containing protein [Mesorhizobium neociceri]MBA1144428.1 PAS domain-containing protein [Mesorhizobium neociceri]